MKTKIIKWLLSALFISAICFTVNGQVPQGFNYQAIARDAGGTVLASTHLPTKVAIQTSTGTILWEEQFDVTSNQFGLISFVVGTGTTTGAGSLPSFSSIDWYSQPLYIKTSIYYPSSWTVMGTTQVYSVPYAISAGSLGTISKLNVTGQTTDVNEALFEVKNKGGQTIFAVYPEGVRIYVSDGDAKGLKGGFAVGGFGSKGPQEYLRVTSDSTRIYTNDNPAKGLKGGFAVGGFIGKSATGNFMRLTKENYFIGHESGSKIPKTGGGLYNSVIGYQAGKSITTGGANTVLGHLAGTSMNTGSNNIILGEYAGNNLTGGEHNTIIGNSAGYSHTNQSYNIMIGTNAGYFVQGSFNTFIGINSGFKLSDGINNVFLGTNAGAMLENGNGNTVIGIDAGRSGDWDPYTPHGYYTSNNTIIGNKAGYNLDAGDNNVIIGNSAGYITTTASGNVFIGNTAGSEETGNNKLYITNQTRQPVDPYGYITPLVFGDFSAHQLGINTTSLSKTLNVGGDANITGTISASNFNGAFTGNLSGNVTGTVTGTLNGNVNGTINGGGMGRIYLAEEGVIQFIDEGPVTLYYVPAQQRIQLINKSEAFVCNYWFRIVNNTTETTESGEIAAKGSKDIIADKIFNNTGFEIHFSQPGGSKESCSTFFQYKQGIIYGHYIKF